MLKVIVAFTTGDPKGYGVEYVNGGDFSIRTDPEFHDLIVSDGKGVTVAIFNNWLWAKSSPE